jgi:hypothetical protein
MFQKNPVKTEKGIFRRDIWGNWWELEVRSFKECFSQGKIPAVSLIHKISETIQHLEGAVAVNDSDENVLVIKGWKKISAVHRIAEIEQSIDSGRTILELDFI